MGFFDRFKNPPLEQYADLFIKALKAVGDTRSWTFEPEYERLVAMSPAETAPSAQTNLTNMFSEYLAKPKSERGAVLARQALAMKPNKIPEDFALVCGKILPIIRSSDMRGALSILQAGAKKRAGAPDHLPYRSLCDALEILIALDSEHAIQTVSLMQIEKWGISFDAALEQSLDNLRARSTKPFKEAWPGLYQSQFVDNYDPSRMLLPEIFGPMKLKGLPVVMAINRDVLLVSGAENSTALEVMVSMAEEAQNKPRPMTPVMLRCSEGEWLDFVPEVLAPRLRKLRYIDQARSYAAQQQQLNTLLEHEGKDIFVAGLKLYESAPVGLYSLCTWTEGVHGLLPLSDVVVLVRPTTNQIVQVSFDAIQSEFGKLLTRTDYIPARFEVNGFPSNAEFEQLFHRFSGRTLAKAARAIDDKA